MRNIITLFFICASLSAILLFTQCGNKQQSDITNKDGRSTSNHSTSGIRIAYINLDTIMYRYEFSLDINKEMISKETKITATLDSKRRKIEEEVAQFEYKCNARIFTDEESYTKEREEIMRKEKEFMDLRDELYYNLEKENLEIGKELRDSINKFIHDYNKKMGYDFILTKIGDNILYANEAFNITKDIVEGLNKRYRNNPRLP